MRKGDAESARVGRIDPTDNVFQLVDAQRRRSDDLREAMDLRLTSMREAEVRRVNEQMALRSSYEEKLRDAEAKRLDAIRAVDVNAVGVASDRATQSATVLAAQVAQSAETLRALVASSAASTAAQLSSIITPITDRLSLVERAQYEGAGKERVSDPAQARLAAAVEALIQAQASGQGASGARQVATADNRWLIGLLLGVPGLIIVLLEVARLATGK